MSYNPYSAINAIYNYKKEWDDADKSGDTAKKNKAAENAKAFYDQLRNNGKKDIADQLSAVDVSGAKYILDQYSTQNSGVDNLAYSTTMQSGVNKNNTLAGYIDSDRKDVQGKYNDIYNYANQDITKTDEYKSTYNNMMGKYDMSALQGRNNAVASGGASNGGNIDSYAAANALRQQTSILAQGQQIAHQAGLDAYNARVSNISNILNNLGVYNSGTYDAMNQAISNDAGLAQQYFDNSETAKNNEVARLKEQAGVTGYTPAKWTYDNNTYLNSDGTVKSIYLTDEFDATGGFETIINDAKSKLATTTDATERANLEATIYYAQQAKNIKTEQNPTKYGKYASSVRAVAPQATYEKWKAGVDNDTVLKSLGIESADTRYGIDAEKEIAKANNQNAIDQINAKTQGEKDILTHTKELSGTGGVTLSEDDIKIMDTVTNSINTILKNNELNSGEIDIILPEGNGKYRLNLPTGTDKESWKDPVIYNILKSNTLSADAKASMIESLGYTSNDITEVISKHDDLK